MKLIPTTIAALIFSATAMQAADSLKINTMEPQMEDIFSILNSMDMDFFRFDLSEFLANDYDVMFYVDEYRDNELVERKYSIFFGTNRMSVNLYPEEQREQVRAMHGLGPEEDKFDYITTACIYTRKTSDSTTDFTVNCPGVARITRHIDLYPVGPDSTYFYVARPFSMKKSSADGNADIPLVMYGSGWYDEENGIVRCCGEYEIDPARQAQILKDSPHYYIIGISLTMIKEN